MTKYNSQNPIQMNQNKKTNEKPISIPLDFDDAMEAFIGVSPPKDEDKQQQSDDSDKKEKVK